MGLEGMSLMSRPKVNIKLLEGEFMLIETVKGKYKVTVDGKGNVVTIYDYFKDSPECPKCGGLSDCVDGKCFCFNCGYEFKEVLDERN